MDSVGGYRVIRRLSGGSTSEMLLAHDAEERTVVLRLLPPLGRTAGDGSAGSTDRAAAGAIEALSAIDHPGLVPLVDFAVLDDGRVLLVHPRIAGGSLGELIAHGGGLTLGEAVTVLTAVSGALDALHRSGWAHTRIVPGTVLLSKTGSPVLAGIGHLQPLTAESMFADLESLRDLALRVLPAQSGLLEQIGSLASDPHLGRSIDEVVSRLADGAPVRLQHRRAELSPRVEDLFPASAGTSVDEGGGVRTAPAWLVDLFAPSGPILELFDRLMISLRQVRRPVWVGAAGVAVALIAAVVLVPPREDPAGAVSSAQGDTSAAADADIDERAGANTDPVYTVADPPASSGPSDEVRGDDPLAAVSALLAMRQRCIAAESPECLDGVVQSGSAAEADALAAIEAVGTGETVPAPIPFDDEAPLVQRTGGSAIITGGAVSVLLVDGDTGWRLRDVFDSPTAD